MNKTKKITVALIAIVLGVIISPAIALSEAGAMKKSVELEDTISTSDIVKTVRVTGDNEIPFAPNSIDIAVGSSVDFLNVDGHDQGISHSVTSVKIGTIQPDGTFTSGILRVGESYTVTFQEPGIYEFYDSLHSTISGRISVKYIPSQILFF